MPYKDMREFLDVLKKDGQLKEIDTPIKAAHGDNELQALMRLLCQNEGPAALLQPKRSLRSVFRAPESATSINARARASSVWLRNIAMPCSVTTASTS